MMCFSNYYVEPYWSVITQREFNFNSSNLSAECNFSNISPDPSVVNVPIDNTLLYFGWMILIYPTIIWVGTIFVRLCHTQWEETAYGLLSPRFVFPPFLWAWYFSTFASQQFNLKLTSAVYLSGWLVTLSFFINAFKKASIFSFLLTEIMVKDIMFSFGIVFACVLVSFSSAIHILREKAMLGKRNLSDTVYNLFASALTTGDFMNETSIDSECDKDRIHLLRAMFAIYLCCTTIILLNLLISMMNNRYDKVREKAKNVWTFQTVHTWILLTALLKLVTLQQVLRTFDIYWRTVTFKFWKFQVDTRYDSASIKHDNGRIVLHLEYKSSLFEKKMLKTRKSIKLSEAISSES